MCAMLRSTAAAPLAAPLLPSMAKPGAKVTKPTAHLSGQSARELPARSPRRVRPVTTCGQGQRSNSTTRKRTSGPPGLPPVNNNDSGGGGGGGWFGPNMVRNIALNGALFGFIFMLDHYSNGGGGGFFGGGRPQRCAFWSPSWTAVTLAAKK
mmetsp:Transcript_155/g.310  ORF Transcript_155/g.310 Transcript_155/m.310 type:complete len:152 (+) Transcript_155:261-716(+)